MRQAKDSMTTIAMATATITKELLVQRQCIKQVEQIRFELDFHFPTLDSDNDAIDNSIDAVIL